MNRCLHQFHDRSGFNYLGFGGCFFLDLLVFDIGNVFPPLLLALQKLSIVLDSIEEKIEIVDWIPDSFSSFYGKNMLDEERLKGFRSSVYC